MGPSGPLDPVDEVVEDESKVASEDSGVFLWSQDKVTVNT